MQSHVEAVRSMVGFVPRSGRFTDAVRGWLETHWTPVGVVGSVAVTAGLLATGEIPPLLTPFVLGPLGAVIITALIAPKRDARPTSERNDPAKAQRSV